MSNTTIEIAKIKEITSKGLWSIGPNGFYVEISLEITDDRENSKKKEKSASLRLIDQEELSSIYVQINVSNSNDENYKEFKNIYTKMLSFLPIVKFLTSYGILTPDMTKGKIFSSLEKILGIDFSSIMTNSQNSSFFMHDSDFKKIGDIFHIETDNTANFLPLLDPYIQSIIGRSIGANILNDFLEHQTNDELFDTYKLGFNFYNYLIRLDNDIAKFDISEILNSPNEKCRNFPSELTTVYNDKNLILIKVTYPIHCYHCILSLSKIISSTKNCPFILNRKSLIFCQKDDNFSSKIKEIKKSSENLTYFIVHPEFLNENDRLTLNEFINDRLNSIDNTDLPKIMIISTTNYRDTFFMHQEIINLCEFKIDNDLIESLYNLSLADKDKYRFQLYYSDKSGVGKSHQIRKDFNDEEKCIFKGDHFLNELFIDASTTTIPNLRYCDSDDDDNNNNNSQQQKNSNYVHFDLSPDLFNSNSYRFFDELWSFCVFENHVNPDGSSFKTPQNIFFEVPLLNKVNFSNGKSFSNLDFPISVHRFNQISIDDVDEIRVSEKVKTFCDKIFKDDIEFVSQLIRITAKMFFNHDSFVLKETKIVSRLLIQFNLFVDYFVNQFSEEYKDENIALFILLLRTNFHIWRIDSIFENEVQLKSFIILAKESLLSTNHDDTRWVLLNFISEGESFKWNTNCLKNNIKNKLEDIQDSNLFEYDLFKVLKDNEDLIQIFSNTIDYENSQAYLFNIIQMYFYQSPEDKDNEYYDLVDGVILNKIKNSPKYDSIRKRFGIIIYGKEEYNKDKMLAFNYKWNSVFDAIKLIYERRGVSLKSILDNLTEDENVEQISKIELSVNIVKKFVIMLIRIILNQSTIFEGSTGVGKTTTMNLFNLLINKAQTNEDFDYRYHQIDCSIDFKVDDFIDIKNSIYYQTGEETKNHIFFCDNLNTSPILHYIINEINKYKKVKNGIGSSVFIAAINPYETVSQFSQNLSLVGRKQNNKQNEKSNLIYDVIKLPESAQLYIVKSDPLFYVFNDEDKKYVENEDSEFLTPEEFYIIQSIVISSLYSLTNRIENKELGICIFSDEDELNNNNFKILTNVMDNYKDDIANIFILLLKKAFSEMRRLVKFKSIFSYRDVKRCMVLFSNFFRKLANVSILSLYDEKKERYKPIKEEEVTNNIIPQAIVLSIMLSIVFRFSNDSKVELNKNAEYSLFIKYGLENTINIRPNLVKELSKVNWQTKKIKQPNKDWNKIVKTYAWIKCHKYLYKDFKNKKENANLLKTNSLILNLFAISSCYYASKNSREDVLPCIVIGPTGSSKTLAFKLFSDYKLKKNKDFHSTTYLSSQYSTSKKLMAQYRDSADIMAQDKDSFSICSIENFNIANLKDKSSVQALHYYMDNGMQIKIINVKKKERKKPILVMPYITTCYSLDYATMNRAIVIYNETPNDKEIAKSFCISESESKSLLFVKKIKKLKKNFYEDQKILKLNDTVHEEKYKNFLSILWKLTPNKKRPEYFSLQPLYLLFNSLFHNNQGCNQETIDNMCVYFSSITSCDPRESLHNIKKMIKKLKNDPYIQQDKSENNIIPQLYDLLNDEKQIISNMFEVITKSGIESNYVSQIKDFINKSKDPTLKPLRDIIKKKDEFSKFIKDINKYSFPGDVSFDKIIDDIVNSEEEEEEDFNDIIESIDINYLILRQNIIEMMENKSRRAMCIKTQNYQCLDFIQELFEKIVKNKDKSIKKVKFSTILSYNDKFKNQSLFNDELNDFYFDLFTNTKEIHFVFIVGNSTISESLLDLLNSSSENQMIENPILTLNGFTIKINELPKNVAFVFIRNESFDNDQKINDEIDDDDDESPINHLLNDRINSFYFDYKSKDEWKVIDSFNEFYEKNRIYSIPHAKHIHDYFNNFIFKLSDIDNQEEEEDIEEEEEEERYTFIFATDENIEEDENGKIIDNKFIHDARVFKHYYLDDDELDTSLKRDIKASDDFELTIVFVLKKQTENYETVNQNINEIIKLKEKHKISFYWSFEYYQVYNFSREISIRATPKPYPKDYSYLKNDKTINILLEQGFVKRKNGGFNMIVLTTSSITEELNFEIELPSSIKKDNSITFYESLIRKEDEFVQKIGQIKKEEHYENVIIRLENYQKDKDRYIRHLIGDDKTEVSFILIYHLNNSATPEGLSTSKKWPVFWVESVTNSPFSMIKTSDIVDCIIYNGIDEDEQKRIYIQAFKQIYNIFDLKFENHINDENKVDEILNRIFHLLWSNDKLNTGVFKKLVGNLKDENSFKNVIIKRDFVDAILNNVPSLSCIYQILLLSFDLINNNDVELTLNFIDKIFEFGKNGNLFKKAEINVIELKQFRDNGVFFPEIILSTALKIYEVYKEKGEDFNAFDLSLFDVFQKIQPNAEIDAIQIFCDKFFKNYLMDQMKFNDEEFNGFCEKLKSLIAESKT